MYAVCEGDSGCRAVKPTFSGVLRIANVLRNERAGVFRYNQYKKVPAHFGSIGMWSVNA